MDETRARQELNLADNAGMPEILAAYEAVLDQARNLQGGDEASMAARLDAAREAFVFLRENPPVVRRRSAPRRADAADTEAAGTMDIEPAPTTVTEIPVKFASFLAQDDRYTGKGVVRVSDRMLVVTARRRALFAWRRRSESFPVAGIRNVSRAGRQVRFATATSKKPWHAVLVCPDEAAAISLAEALPDATDTALFAAHDVHRDLQQRLEAVSGPTIAVWVLLALNLLAYFIVGNSGAGWMSASPEKLIGFGGNFSPYTTDGQWWRLLSCTFLHGGLVHLAFNMFALYSFGRLAERLYGTTLFAAIYLATGLAGSAASLMTNPTVVSVGASGAIFGIMGLLVAFVARDRSFLPEASRRQLFINWAIFAAYAFSQGLGKTGIDNAAHFGGLISGLAIGFIIGTPIRLAPDSGARTGRRAIAALVATLIASGAAAASAPRLAPDFHAHRALLDVMQAIGKHEQQMANDGKQMAERQKAGTLAQSEGVAVLERMLGDYRQIDTRLRMIEARPNALKARQTLFIQFVALRQEGLGLLIEAERQQNEGFAEMGKQKLEAGNRLVPEMLKPLKWHE